MTLDKWIDLLFSAAMICCILGLAACALGAASVGTDMPALHTAALWLGIPSGVGTLAFGIAMIVLSAVESLRQ